MSRLICERCGGIITAGTDVTLLGDDVEHARILSGDDVLVCHAACPNARAWLAFLDDEAWQGTLEFVSMDDAAAFGSDMVERTAEPPFEWDALIAFDETQPPPDDKPATHQARASRDGWNIRELA